MSESASDRSPPGLAYERTALAWSRTAMGTLIVAGLLVRFAERGRAPIAGEVAAAIALAVSAGVWLHARRFRSQADLRHGPATRELLALTFGVLVVTVAAGVAILLALV